MNKKKKAFLAVAMAACILVSSLVGSFAVYAGDIEGLSESTVDGENWSVADAEAAGLKYDIVADRDFEVTILEYTGSVSTLVLPKTIEGRNVTHIWANAFENCTSLVNVVIPNGYELIFDYAFYGCSNLESVSIPESVKFIGCAAFQKCNKLTRVDIPEGVTTIDNSAFRECIGLCEITIPYSVTEIGDYAFEGCTALQKVCYPQSAKEWDAIIIGLKNDCLENADIIFGKEIDLTEGFIEGLSYEVSGGEVTITGYTGEKATEGEIPGYIAGSPVTAIGKNAFSYCKMLTKVTIPEGIKRIDEGAFSYCENLSDITVPNSVTAIGPYAFSVTAYSNDASNWDGGFLYIDNALISVKQSVSGNVEIKDGTAVIADDAFYFCYNITGVTIPDSVKFIGKTAFKYCELLESVVLSKNLTVIEENTFLGCTKLTSVTIPSGVTKISDGAFEECYALSTVYYGGTAEQWADITVGENNYHLTNANIVFEKEGPESSAIPEGLAYEITDGEVTVTKYTGDATDVVIPDTIDGYPVTSIANRAFYNCTRLSSVTIPDGVTSIGDGAFVYCNKLASVTLPESITSIGESAFAYCSALEGIAIPDSVTNIGDEAFYYCHGLKSIVIPMGVTSIGDWTFSWCTSLASVTFHDRLISIGVGSFDNCQKLTSVRIPKSVTSINEEAFNSCTSLDNISVDEGNAVYHSAGNCIIETAAKTLVAGCKNSVIPDDGSVTGIGKCAFYFCTYLESIDIPDSVTNIGDYAFFGCSTLESLEIPGSVTSIGKGAFNTCYTIKNIAIKEGVTSIGDEAFLWCNSLESITIPDSVTSIGDGAFDDCEKLSTVYYGGHSGQWADISVGEDNEFLTNANIIFAKENVCTHKYTNKCDKTCNICGKVRTITHSYTAATCTKAKTCSVCKATSGKALGHKYDNKCDATCNRCKATRKITHTYKTTTTKATLAKNGSIVKKCTVCGYVGSKTVVKYAKTFKLSANTFVYNNKAKTPAVTVKDSAGKVLKKGTDYTVTYAAGRKNVGTYKVTVKMIGKYTGTKTLTFKINPQAVAISKITAGVKSFTAAWAPKAAQVTGYEIQYSTAKSFSGAKKVTVTSNKTKNKVVRSLKAGKKYFVRIRTYKTVGKVKFYSAWSAAKTVTPRSK